MKGVHYIIMLFCIMLGFFGGYLVFYKNIANNIYEQPKDIGDASSFIDDNIDANIVLDADLKQELDQQDNSNTSDEIRVALKNISTTLDNGFMDDQHLTYYGVGNSLLFPFLSSRDQCDNFLAKVSTSSPQRFYEECMFQYYLKKLLENKGEYDVPEAMLSEYSILRNIADKKCNVEQDFQCMLLFTKGMSRDEFLTEMPQLMEEKGFTVDSFIRSVSIVSYGMYVFHDYIEDIKNLNQVLNLYYDEALIQKAVYEDDISHCDEMIYTPSQNYCKDLFDDSSNKKYLKLFNQFYSISG